MKEKIIETEYCILKITPDYIVKQSTEKDEDNFYNTIAKLYINNLKKQNHTLK